MNDKAMRDLQDKARQVAAYYDDMQYYGNELDPFNYNYACDGYSRALNELDTMVSELLEEVGRVDKRKQASE